MSRRSVVLGLGTVLVCAWCGWVAGFHRDTAAAEVTWIVSLCAVVAVDVFWWAGRKGLRWGWRLEPARAPWPRPGRGGGRQALRGVSPWLGLVVVAVAWDVLALDTPANRYHLTISALSQAYRPLDAAVLLIWLGLGFGYGATRARAPSRPGGAPASPLDDAPDSQAALAGLATSSVTGHRAFAGPVSSGLLLPNVPAAGVAFWVAVPLLALVIDQAARRSGGRIANAEEVLRFISTATAAKVVLVAAWAFAGYHLFAR